MGLCGGKKAPKPPQEAPGILFNVIRWITWAGTVRLVAAKSRVATARR
jgi:hypothetical protein